MIDTFGSEEGAIEWLEEFCPVLGGRPVDLMGDEQGQKQVNDILVCIDYGLVY